MNFTLAIQAYAGQPLTQQVLFDLLRAYRWPHNKIRQLEKQGLLTPVKRGLYITGPKLNIPPPPLPLIANHLYGPSYVSMESALSYWGFIPERVVAISSITTGVSKTFKTSVGRFVYIHATLPYYSYGVRQVKLSDQHTVLMACAEKALCDKIINTSGIILRSVPQTANFLLEDLRIEKSSLKQLHSAEIESWISGAPKKQSLSVLVKTLKTL